MYTNISNSTSTGTGKRHGTALVGLAIAAAVQLLGLTPQPASAAPAAQLTCTMTEYGATGSATTHNYSFTLDCKLPVFGQQAVAGTFSGSYETSTGVAQERYTTETGTTTTKWQCPQDPWNRAAAVGFSCERTSHRSNLTAVDAWHTVVYDHAGPYPFSAANLSDTNRYSLNVVLQNSVLANAPATGTVGRGGRPINQHPGQQGRAGTAATGTENQPTIDRASDLYVRWLQNALNTVDNAEIPIDGDFGPVTDRAVRHFQKGHGLQVDGVVGPVTEAALVKAGAATPPGPSRTGEAKQK